MPFIKDPFSVLAEAAEADLQVNTEASIEANSIKTYLESVDEVSEDIVITAEMVTVIKVGEDLLAEMTNIASYMKSNGIKSVAEALDNIAKVNGLEPKSVGLLTESDDYVNAMLEKAVSARKKGNNKTEKTILEKIKKATDISAKLQKNGYPVKKKKCC